MSGVTDRRSVLIMHVTLLALAKVRDLVAFGHVSVDRCVGFSVALLK